MVNGLFNNKYYNELFGGRRNDEEEEDNQSEETMQTGGSENTRERLERIFGGNPRGKRLTPEERAARLANKPRVLSDAEYAAKSGMATAGQTTDGKTIFVFKNGAQAVRDNNGRFSIVKAPTNLTGLRSAAAAARAARAAAVARGESIRRGNKVVYGKIDKADAEKAFTAYWNRKKREAARFNAAHNLKGTRQSKLAAAKRSETYRRTYAHKNAKYHLDESSPRGYLYLRKEKLIRSPDGSIRRTKSGKPSIRRAGPAIYDFIGVAPRSMKMSKRRAPSAKAIEAIRASVAARKGRVAARSARAAAASPTSRSSDEIFASRAATLEGKRAARSSMRTPPRSRKASSKASKAKKPTPAPEEFSFGSQ